MADKKIYNSNFTAMTFVSVAEVVAN